MTLPERPPHSRHQVVGSAARPHVVVDVANGVEGGELVRPGDDDDGHRLGAIDCIYQGRSGPVLADRRQVDDRQVVRHLKRFAGARWPQGRKETVGLERV